MKKKIANFLRKLKKNKKTKPMIVKNDKSKVINFVNRSKNSNKIQTEQMEVKKMDALAKELVENYLKASRRSFLDMGYCFYVFLFRLLQRMIFQFSYPVYIHYLRTTSKEILNNHKEWMHEFKEWDEAPKKGKLMGEKNQDHENDTLH